MYVSPYQISCISDIYTEVFRSNYENILICNIIGAVTLFCLFVLIGFFTLWYSWEKQNKNISFMNTETKYFDIDYLILTNLISNF